MIDHTFTRLLLGARAMLLCILITSVVDCNVSASEESTSGSCLPPVSAREVLRRQFELKPSELQRIDSGRPVARVLKRSADHEFAVMGVVKLHVSAPRFMDGFRRIEEFKRSEGVRQISRLSNPPRPSDFSMLRFPVADIRSLGKCRVGRCDLKLPAASIERIQEDIDWSSREPEGEVESLLRALLLSVVDRHSEQGNAGLIEYSDKRPGRRVVDELTGILNASDFLRGHAPALHRALMGEAPFETAERFVYWSQEDFGYKPVVSLTNVTIESVSRGSLTDVVIASKQLYASHYFEASLELIVLLEAPPYNGRPSLYVVQLNRSRFDGFRGRFTGVKRLLLRRRAQGAIKGRLAQLKQRLERPAVEAEPFAVISEASIREPMTPTEY